jgi:hypothetical protein
MRYLLLCLLISPLATASADAQERFVGFVTPSKNISCQLDTKENVLRCDVAKIDVYPPRPADCDLEYGNAFQVSAKDGARRICAGDTTMNPSLPVLAYGEIWQRADFKCRSEQAALTCLNAMQDGFTLSRVKQEIRNNSATPVLAGSDPSGKKIENNSATPAPAGSDPSGEKIENNSAAPALAGSDPSGGKIENNSATPALAGTDQRSNTLGKKIKNNSATRTLPGSDQRSNTLGMKIKNNSATPTLADSDPRSNALGRKINNNSAPPTLAGSDQRSNTLGRDLTLTGVYQP